MGILDDLFAQPKDPQTWMPPSEYTDPNPFMGLDMTGAVPVMRKKTEKEKADETTGAWDRDKKKIDETNPYVPASGNFPAITPQQKPAQLPVMGYGQLGPELSGPFSAVNGLPPGPSTRPANAAPPAPPPPPAPAPVQPAPPVSTAPAPTLPPQVANARDADQPKRDPDTGAIDMTNQPIGMLSKVWDGIKNNSNLLLGMGAGLTGAPSWAQGFSRGFAGAAAGNQLDYQQSRQLSSQSALYQSLRSAMIANGVDPKTAGLQAFAATQHPELAKSLIAEHITEPKVEYKTLKDPLAGDRLVAVPKHMKPEDIAAFNAQSMQGGPGAGGLPQLPPIDAATGQIMPAGAPGGAMAQAAPGAAPPADTGSPEITSTFQLSKMPIEIDPTTGRDEKFAEAMKRVSPKAYATTMGVLNGDMSTSGRNLQAYKEWAKRIEPGWNEYTATARAEFAKELGGTKNGVGLAAKGFKQGLEHFVRLSDNLVKMNLSNGLGLEKVAGVVNAAKGQLSSQQELIHKSDVEGQALSREMGNLFSKNGGGVHEAAETKKNISNAYMSSSAAAGSLEAVDELMQGGLKTLEDRRDQLFPNGNAPKGSDFLGAEQKAALEHIRRNIAILKGETPAAAPAPALKPGGTYRYNSKGELVQ